VERHFHTELRQLKDQILAMGGYVERAIEEATQALIRREPERFEKVEECEKKINQAHIDVDDHCFSLLARQAPLAADLRLILACIKINTDLERMGDQAVNISHNTQRYLKEPPVQFLLEITKMAFEVRSMVRDSLDALVKQDGDLAQDVLKKDDFVDQLKDQMFSDLVATMKKDPSTIDAALDLLLIARNLERLGDHATNIAEDVIFVTTGRDVRHKPRSETQTPEG
jgi:phosphate transport system protein